MEQTLLTLVLACAILLGCSVFVQADPGAQAASEAPKPGPDLEKLHYFNGTWQNKGDVKASEYGPAGKVSGADRREWILHGFVQRVQHEEKNPSGEFRKILIVCYDYDPEKKVYRRYTFGDGRAKQAEGTLEGDTWTWTSDAFQMNGVQIRTRTVITPRSATSYDWKWQTARPNTDWATVQEGTYTKMK